MSPGKLATSSSSPPHYQSLPQFTNHRNDDDDPYENYVALPYFIPVPYRISCNGILFALFTFLLITTSLYILWPSDPELTVVRLRLANFNAHVFPRVSLDIEIDLMVRVSNPDVYSLEYESMKVMVVYRGSQLGFVKSDGGEVKARGFSYVNATLRLDGIEVLSDAVLLIEDLARGVIPIDTVTEVVGRIGFVFIHVPIKILISAGLHAIYFEIFLEALGDQEEMFDGGMARNDNFLFAGDPPLGDID